MIKWIQWLILGHMFVRGAYINTHMIYQGMKFQGCMTSPSDITGVFIEKKIAIFQNFQGHDFNMPLFW